MFENSTKEYLQEVIILLRERLAELNSPLYASTVNKRDKIMELKERIKELNKELEMRK